MEEILRRHIGKKLDITLEGNIGYKGEITTIENGVVELRDEHGRMNYIAASKVSAFCEIGDQLSRPGFIA